MPNPGDEHAAGEVPLKPDPAAMLAKYKNVDLRSDWEAADELYAALAASIAAHKADVQAERGISGDLAIEFQRECAAHEADRIMLDGAGKTNDELWRRISVHEADKNDAQELARLMYGSPALRLAYCQDHALLPPIDVRTSKYPAFACVDEYWRTAIAGEVIVGRHLALAAGHEGQEEKFNG